MNVQFIASVSIISADPGTTRGLLTRVFGLPLQAGSADPDYVFSEHIEGSKHLEPWGQIVCRLLSAEGAILGVSFAPWLHGKTP